MFRMDIMNFTSQLVIKTTNKNYFLKKKFPKKINIHIIDTGKNTMTGGRLKRQVHT